MNGGSAEYRSRVLIVFFCFFIYPFVIFIGYFLASWLGTCFRWEEGQGEGEATVAW